ncbi:ORF6N domain-containing protein [Acidithiobacillus thiooxidans]|uniref:ORF6N domain-containing protein n=2 Tax=Acidithiobacillaceae TaxID=225058 RepID=A0AAE2YNQ9_9PROT|nr:MULTISPECIES: ORF6N domain-containing protein [Acidithiobacillaceae]MBU2795835.1 ORF6N domain-containing protein [Acidithiobacillus sp. VAN18-2]MBU2787245.1 ORF6N domain-containing protein [Igneacidithiobacillus copahuensis]MBU2796624.1 ORF6N domain-containing protein [Acidithiobacillus sp. VAN18-2]MBU2797576.1 ORF6N domain-containing protein [Acidithiobacillus sp. VAN18-2]MBU2839168.1 ORF6N domain-containing protein [Acidithiobacillus thiooxidans]
MTVSESSLNIETLSQRIYSIRSLNVILDADLAELYGVTTKRLNEQVKRNLDRFPPDFMFQLDDEEHAILRSQIATSNTGRGGRRYLPYAFTEHGAIMAATVLNSAKAIEMSVFVVRTFVHLRRMLMAHKELAEKLNALERTVSTHDQALAGLINALRELMQAPNPQNRPIGFTADIDGGGQ